MTWSPFLSVVTPAPTSTTTPAPSWPRIAGKSPSGSAPERVNSSVWQMPVALISTSTSPAFGPSRRTVSINRGSPALCATAARTSIVSIRLHAGGLHRRGPQVELRPGVGRELIRRGPLADESLLRELLLHRGQEHAYSRRAGQVRDDFRRHARPA